jgi:hypothetical protein
MALLDMFPGIVYQCKDNVLSEVTEDYNTVQLINEEDKPSDENLEIDMEEGQAEKSPSDEEKDETGKDTEIHEEDI